MLTHERNLWMTQTGRKTPAGQLMRCYWQPVALSEEMPLGAPPLAVTVLGEDLVLFRDEAGQLGLLDAHCAHRGADLTYGRLENGGLRCLYHGWLYDVQGRCLEQPAEPPHSTFCEKVRQPAFPCQEAGGLIFGYLGEDGPPQLPAYEFLQGDPTLRYVSKIYQACNYLQGNEGNLDPSHLSYLHRQFVEVEQRTVNGSSSSPNTLYGQDTAPILDAMETDFGVRIISRRRVDDQHVYVRVSNFVMPNLSAFPGPATDGYSVHWHVPIDDTHHWKYNIIFNRAAPLDADGLGKRERLERGADYHLHRTLANRFHQSRDDLLTKSFSGMGPNFQVHDAWATSSAGPIQDRAQEHLGYTDKAIAKSRQVLWDAIAAVENGQHPRHRLSDGYHQEDPLIVLSQVLPLGTAVDELFQVHTPGPL